MERVPRVDPANGRLPSTTWVWKLCKVTPPPGGDRAPKALRKGVRARDKWKPQTIEISYRGGPESSWLVRCGASCRRVPGYLAVEDMMTYVLGGRQGR